MLKSMDLTPTLIAAVERIEPDPGPEPGRDELRDHEYDDIVDACIAEFEQGPVHVFAYGSLIWRPAFEHAGWERARAYGWRRSFCMHINRWRGSPDLPGLMMGLDHGGSCDGILFRLPDDTLRQQLRSLYLREVSYPENVVCARHLTVRTADGPRRALTFYAGMRRDDCYRKLTDVEQAVRLARAAGHLGSGAAYLHNTIVKLAEYGIHDTYLWRLQALVAAEIRRLYPHL